MQATLIKVLWAMIEKILTYTVLSKFMVYGMWKLSQMTENKVDDKMVAATAEALGVTDYK